MTPNLYFYSLKSCQEHTYSPKEIIIIANIQKLVKIDVNK